jgi:hypothetical protein
MGMAWHGRDLDDGLGGRWLGSHPNVEKWRGEEGEREEMRKVLVGRCRWIGVCEGSGLGVCSWGLGRDVQKGEVAVSGA